MDTNDPFNYPAMNRKDLMYLSTINQFKDGIKTTTKKFVSNRTNSSNLYTMDIEGAQPKQFGSRTFNRPEFQNYNIDIEGSMPRQLHFGLDRPEYNLEVADIKGTQPDVMKDTIKTKRITNPLVPEYKLPEVEKRPPTPPKFIRDPIPNDDIEGARPKKQRVYATRELLDNKDIEGAHPKKFKPRNTKYEYIDYSDLRKEEFHTKRVVDPQNPIYLMKDYAGNPLNYGHIEGSQPKPLPYRGTGEVSMDLHTGDIVGAQATTKGLGPFAQRARTTVKQTVNSLDIEGAQASTIKNRELSKRAVDPLNPSYFLPGQTQKIRQDNVYGEPWVEQPIKKTGTRTKPEWQKSSVIPIIDDKKEEKKGVTPVSAEKVAEDFKLRESMAKFYGVDPRSIKPEELRRFAEESTAVRRLDTPKIDPQMASDPVFQEETKVFFGDKTDGWNKNINKFYQNNEVKEEKFPSELYSKPEERPPKENPSGGLYNRNEDRFFGVGESRPESRGSVFQQNAAHFFDYETPHPGDRPYQPPTGPFETGPARKPVLAQRQLLNHERDPRFQSNAKKFFGADQGNAKGGRPMTYEQRLSKFIGL